MSLPSLLYVDSDARDRSTLGFLLKGAYRFVAVANLEQAKKVLAEESIDLVLCDHQLEDGSGLEFLVELQSLYPDCFRMLLTGVASGDQIIRAINQGHIYYYFQKPLPEGELRMVLDHAMELKRLKSRNAELISSLESKNDDLEKSETLFRSLLEHVPDGVLICNPEGKIVMANHGAEKIFQGQRRDLTGLPVNQLFVDDLMNENRPDSVAHEVSVRRLDGGVFSAELTKNLAKTPDTALTVMVVRDISERKLAEVQLRDLNVRLEQKVHERTAELERVNRQLSRQEKRKDILRRVASAANSSIHDSALETCLWEICRFLDLEFGQIWLVTPDDTLEKSGISCAPRFAGPRCASWSGDYLTGILDTMQDLMVIYETPAEAADILAAGHDAAANGCVMAFPVRVKGRVEAIFEFLSRKEIKPDDWSRGIIQDIAVEMSELFLRRSLETARIQVLVALQRSETRFRNLVESANAISWEMGWPGYELHYVSPGAENILGYSREFWYEPGFWDKAIVPEDHYLFEEQMNDSVNSNSQVSFEFRLNTLSGQARWLRCFAYPQRIQGSDSDKLSGIMFDITELKNAQEAAVQASVAKSAFLAMMSHELRTPLNGVIGLVELMARTELDGDQRHMLATMRDSAFSLLHLIDDILDFSKIEAGRLELEQISFDLLQVVESVAENLAYNAASKGLRMELIVEPGITNALYGDPVRFRQILMNLVGNALKFTRNTAEQQGRVLIRIGRLPGGASQPGCFRVQVEDNGIGMSEETRLKLFKPFTQGEESTTRRFGGTGLGLSICARLVELMGSSISVESREGSGSIFNVDFRLSPDTIKLAEKTIESPIPQIEAIVLSSDPIEVDSISFALQAMSYQARIFSEWGDLCDYLRDDDTQRETALIFGLHCHFEPVNVMEQFHSLPHIRLIKLVVRGQLPLFRINPVMLHAYGNPLLPSNLSRALAGIDLGDESLNPLDYGVAAPQTEDVSAIERGLTRILLAEDNETNQMVLVRQLHSLGYRTRVANDGKQALELFGAEPFDLVLTDCHMPVMDGFELVAAIRGMEGEGQHMPILAITANAVQGEAERCLAAGFDDCITKPVEMRIMQQVLQRWVAHGEISHNKTDQNLASQAPGSYTLENSLDFDSQALEEFIGPDLESQNQLIESFLRNLSGLAEKISTALESNDLETAGMISHTLKSSAKAVGALKLSNLCGQIEASFRHGSNPATIVGADEFSRVSQAARNAIESRSRKGSLDGKP